MALSGEHMSFCPHKSHGNCLDCLCWRHAVKQWDETKKLTAIHGRIYKQKTHSDVIICGARNVTLRSNDLSVINCKHCLKALNKPVKNKIVLPAILPIAV